jgi:hypothetical protein
LIRDGRAIVLDGIEPGGMHRLEHFECQLHWRMSEAGDSTGRMEPFNRLLHGHIVGSGNRGGMDVFQECNRQRAGVPRGDEQLGEVPPAERLTGMIEPAE